MIHGTIVCYQDTEPEVLRQEVIEHVFIVLDVRLGDSKLGIKIVVANYPRKKTDVSCVFSTTK